MQFDILEELGIDPEDFQWQDLAACKGIDDVNYFFDKYEKDRVIAEHVDQLCMVCPVRSFCLRDGMENKEEGVWGGVYLTNGEPDRERNSHKTEEDWKKLADAI